MLNIEQLKATYNLTEDFKLEDIIPIVQNAEKKSFKVGEYILKKGDIQKNLYFIQKGLVRAFDVKSNKEEITTFLRWENQFFASQDIVFFNQPAQFYYQALEPTEILFMNSDVFEQTVAQIPRLEINRKFVLYKILQNATKQINSFILLSPEERYLEFIKVYPNILQRVPIKYIANILGITPVSLSRIRKRIMEKKK